MNEPTVRQSLSNLGSSVIRYEARLNDTVISLMPPKIQRAEGRFVDAVDRLGQKSTRSLTARLATRGNARRISTFPLYKITGTILFSLLFGNGISCDPRQKLDQPPYERVGSQAMPMVYRPGR